MTKSPTVSLPADTPIAAITMTMTSPVVIRNACPKFSMLSDWPVLTAARS
ncbi:hypothetical protein GALL_527510 [mine drainage metagenome]|uniref:Uncharacterized protein n=1 Tax=mine drainage metagenome TaxID=410659 RepID=A0A1J5P4N5_9ZZZZ